LFLGRVVDEHKEDFETGDFLVHNVVGGDRESGAIAVNDTIEVGMTVQFHIRDAQAAHDDLDRVLSRAASADVDAALLFTCNGRGSRLFGEPDHDAGMVASHLGPVPTAGLFAAGELGPLGGRNELHSFTASMLLFREHQGVGMVTL
jgi:small ligand-binding sensory domain FIST